MSDSATSREERKAAAKKIVRNKIDFIRHFLIYGIVIVLLAVINNTTYAGYQWWLWPALGWGIGVFSHFLSAYLFSGGGLERRLVQRELEGMKDEKDNT